jgi:hypothetical protein
MNASLGHLELVYTPAFFELRECGIESVKSFRNESASALGSLESSERDRYMDVQERDESYCSQLHDRYDRDADLPQPRLELPLFLLRLGLFELALKLCELGGVTSPPPSLLYNPFTTSQFPSPNMCPCF